MIRFLVTFLLTTLLFFAPAHAATKTLCNSGCDYTQCSQWVSYLELIQNLLEPEILEVQGAVNTNCFIEGVAFGGVSKVITTPQNYIEIKGASSCKHLGFDSFGACRISSPTITLALINVRAFRVTNMVVEGDEGIFVSSGSSMSGTTDWRVTGNVLVGIGGTLGLNISNNGHNEGHIRVSNNISYNWVLENYFFTLGASGNVVRIYNNTSVNAGVDGVSFQSLAGGSSSWNIISRNNISYNSGGSDYSVSGVTLTSENNLSSDATGSASFQNKTLAFINAGSKNYQLSVSDTDAIDEGLDLSADAVLPITDDIVGNARPQGAAFDIGASEYTAPPTPTPTPTPTATPTPTSTPVASSGGMVDRFLRRPCAFCRWW